MERNRRSVWKRFESYGLIGGTCIGLLVGVLVSGPNFHKWDVDTSVWVIFGSTAFGGLLGFFAQSMALACVADGSAYDQSDSSDVDAGSNDSEGSDDA